MTQTHIEPTPTRRNLLGHIAGAAAIACAPLAARGEAPTSAPWLVPGHPSYEAFRRLVASFEADPHAPSAADAELIAACAEFTRLELLARATLDGPRDIKAEDTVHVEASRVWEMQDAHLDALCTATPRTREGAMAVFQAAMLWLEEDYEDDPEDAHDARLRAAAHRAALLGLTAGRA